MNIKEAFLISKMIEHLNTIHQHSLILHPNVYDEVFRPDEQDLTINLDELRASMLKALQKAQLVGYSRISDEDMLPMEEMSQIIKSNSSLKPN